MTLDQEELEAFYHSLPAEYKQQLEEIEDMHDGTWDDFVGMIEAFKLGMQYQKEKANDS